jgi:predicted dinucleotide-binding enzyme
MSQPSQPNPNPHPTSTTVGIVGAGRIGGNVARQLARAGYPVSVSFSRDPDRLAALAAEIGARAVEPGQAAGCDVVVLSVPWGAIDEALAACGSLAGRIVVDTTNQFGAGGALDLGDRTAARVNADRMPGVRYTKCFNTLTSAFQAATAGRTGGERVVQWIAADDQDAAATVAGLVDAAGYAPLVVAGIDGCQVMEAPRRAGAVYGEEYRLADAERVVAAVRAGHPIPPPPAYPQP